MQNNINWRDAKKEKPKHETYIPLNHLSVDCLCFGSDSDSSKRRATGYYNFETENWCLDAADFTVTHFAEINEP